MVIYISAPYSKGDVGMNIRRACLAGDELLRKGHIPFVPHLSHLWHLISPKSYEEWLRIDFNLMGMCDAVLRLEGESKGSDLEIEQARHLRILIYYSVDEVPPKLGKQ